MAHSVRQPGFSGPSKPAISIFDYCHRTFYLAKNVAGVGCKSFIEYLRFWIFLAKKE